MMPDGCELKEDMMVMCHSKDSEVIGEFLANFQLFSMVLGVLGGVVGVYCFAAAKYGHSDLGISNAIHAQE